MKRIQNYLTQNLCYQQGKPLIPSCIQIHSIGIPQPRAERIMENWNRPEANAMVHAILEANGTVYEIMEYNKCPWADKGYANRHAIAFEMTEPDTIRYTEGAVWEEREDGSHTQAHVLGTYRTAVEYTAYLCKKFNLDPLGRTKDNVPIVFSHNEGSLLGISSNHSDPAHLWKVYGLNMEQFRKDVKNLLENGKVPEIEALPIPPAPSRNDYQTGQNLWKVYGLNMEQFRKDVKNLLENGKVPEIEALPIPPAPSRNDYQTGQNYCLLANMCVRIGPGTEYRRKAYKELTSDGQKNDRDKNGCLEKGTTVTCQEIAKAGNEIWIRIPSGWICAENAGTVYVKNEAGGTALSEQGKNSWVRELQHQLNLQFSAGLAEDGIAGSETLAACITCRPGARGEITRLIQSKVGSTADGIWGNNTTAAVRAYQSTHGLTADGIVGKNTWRAMLGL